MQTGRKFRQYPTPKKDCLKIRSKQPFSTIIICDFCRIIP